MKRKNLAVAAIMAAVLAPAAPTLAGTSSPTMTTVSSSLNPMTISDNVTFTATITPNESVGCTGTAAFTASGATPCSGVVISPNGAGGYAATCTVVGSALGGPGAKSVVATYSGSGACTASTSLAFSQTVLAAATSVPTVGEWTLWGMMGLMMMGGAALLIRRTRRLS